jgi:diaminopimelate epimerase
MIPRTFEKMEGCGNSFLVRIVSQGEISMLKPFVSKLCSLAVGIGSDGIMLIEPPSGTGFEVAMFNPDGSAMGMCGNGIRCVARHVFEKGLVARPEQWIPFTVEGRRIECKLAPHGSDVEVNMGAPIFEPSAIPLNRPQECFNQPISTALGTYQFSAVSMGNPHCIIFVKNLAEVNLAAEGALLEVHPDYPKRTNVSFVEVIDKGQLKMRVWERGAGITQACGTAACATLVAACRTQRSNAEAIIELPGGCVTVRWDQEKNLVFLKGPATPVATIEMAQDFFN